MPSARANIIAKLKGPDGQVGEAGDAVEDAHRRDEAGGGEQQWQAGGGQRAERQHEDHGGDGPGEDLGLHHAFAVDRVEVAPRRRANP
jgi:hypothetical protein